MKPFQKVLAAVVAVVLVVSMASCVPISLKKEWSYKYNDKTYDIGVYIAALKTAYDEAEEYAKKADGYSADKDYSDLTIKVDGKEYKASDWIKQEAEQKVMNMLALDKLVKEYGVKYDSKKANEAAKNVWEIGESQSSFDPLQKKYEEFGVSFESFALIYENAGVITAKKNALFDKLYGKGGKYEVSDKEVKKYFKENYIDYALIPVSTTKAAEDGEEATDLTKNEIKSLKKALNELVDKYNEGSMTYSDLLEQSNSALKAFGIEENKEENLQEHTVEAIKTFEEAKENKQQTEEGKKFIETLLNLKEGKAELYAADVDGKTEIEIIIKNKLDSDYIKENHITGGERETYVAAMKDKDLEKMIEDKASEVKKDSKLEKNTSVLDRYKPSMFFKESDKS